MGKIFCLMGKSSSGKDTLYRMLLNELQMPSIIPYTTRPIRGGEQEGVEYHFITDEDVERLQAQGKVIELRAYHTVHGIWKYLTVDDRQVDLTGSSYLMIGTVEAYSRLKEYYGEKYLVPIYIEVDDGVRLQRALDRERMQKKPKYAEMCRRFLADEEDFSEARLAKAGITRKFLNMDLEQTKQELAEYIRSCEGSSNMR